MKDSAESVNVSPIEENMSSLGGPSSDPFVRIHLALLTMPESAAIIATRNRPRALRNTLTSIAAQDLSPRPIVILIDGSEEKIFRTNQSLIDRFSSFPIIHQRYSGEPSAAKQRNCGIRLLPPPIEIIFFLDDDISLHPGCLRRLVAALESSCELGGVGAIGQTGLNSQETARSSSPWKHLFLLDHSQPGRVLLSGHVSRYSSIPRNASLTSVQWLSTCCCAYKRSVLDEHQFDEALSGALFEDRDLSYRIAKSYRLAAVPTARYTHHRSSIHRKSVSSFARERDVQRYWFIRKNMRRPLRYVAFWWATIGHLLAVLRSSKDQKWQALRGHLQGIEMILKRDHPLLRGSQLDSEERP